jgi:mediator of RNA polymerase II transcription subunit 17
MSGLVTIETPLENQVVEVTYDGQEILQAPLTLAEHLTKQANKVDFDTSFDGDEDLQLEDEEDMDEDGSDVGDDDEEADDDDEDEELPNRTAADAKAKAKGNAKGAAAQQHQTWEWKSVRDKLKDALTEMAVLSDVITVATRDCGKDPATGNPRRYMVLDGPVQYEPPEPRPTVTLLAKKKSLDVPAKILQAGAEHLKSLQNENKKNRTAEDFHFELLRLRQNWRLKKVSNTILGDLSYRTAGSQYKQSGVFEVVKADDSASLPVADSATAAMAAASASTAAGSSAADADKAQKSALKVNVPSELEGIAYIQVTIQKESEQLVTTNLSHFGAFGANPPDQHWQKKLEAAQNVLFCKELFAQLAKEAIKLQAPIPHMVVGNQITASLFLDIQLIISLCHSTGSEKKCGGGSGGSGAGGGAAAASGGTGGSASAPPPQSQRDHSHVLEHSLHQLLRLQHSRNINPDSPCLSSAPVGISKRRRLAGPRAADRRSLMDMATRQTLLEQIIQQAQHVVLRLRTMFVLDTMAKDLKDPLITCHLGTLRGAIHQFLIIILNSDS